MKRMILCGLILFSLMASAQTRKQKKSTRTVTKKTTVKSTVAKTNKANIFPSTIYTLTNSTSNTANSVPVTRFSITDPVITTMNDRVHGSDVQIGKSPIIGMPKRYYGIAKGHIFLHTTDATSTGGNTGSGSVGTGSSIGTMGTAGQGMGVNGKSPYAPLDIYGIPGSLNTSTPRTTQPGKKNQ